jgi:hypothetical protein
MIKKLKIIASKENIYTGQVAKIKNESKLPTEVVYIEDIIDTNNVQFDFENSIVYFLCCNSALVPTAIRIVEKYDCYIINKEYLIKDYLKLDIQKLLEKNNVNVPQIYDTENVEKIKFPIFCKENRHEGIIIQAYNKITLTRFFNKFNTSDFYLEQAIENDTKKQKEFKVYFVKGKIFFKDIADYDSELAQICEQVSTSLNNLEIFSADIIQNSNGENFIIDVNPSAGFYLSDEGRKYFLENLTKV